MVVLMDEVLRRVVLLPGRASSSSPVSYYIESQTWVVEPPTPAHVQFVEGQGSIQPKGARSVCGALLSSQCLQAVVVLGSGTNVVHCHDVRVVYHLRLVSLPSHRLCMTRWIKQSGCCERRGVVWCDQGCVDRAAY